ncbi:ATPase domain-containing protein [Haloplanus salilacus]|uniref:ATPase domain-containing protein n=1 Tax=Haloplanus salilacus TaxID=2949994 RepID=UPI0030D52248
MSTDTSRVGTGAPILDAMIGGGLPRKRSVLVTGGPGTGKSTLGMQFLQAGLPEGDDCLYISTEQTIGELRDSFAGFAFDLDHDSLAFASIHAKPGRPVESDEQRLTLTTLGEDGDPTPFGSGFDAPFTAEYIRDYLARYGQFDRVVFDSVSGLSVIAEGDEQFRRSVLDLIRYFSDDVGATTLFTAEHRSSDSLSDALQFTTHGVIELSRRRIVDDPHLSIEVTKMRGVRHDRRRAEVQFTDEGLRIGPERRSQPPVLKTHTHRPLGIDGLDALCGGGPVCGAGVLLEHDGEANLMALFGTILADAVDRGDAITLVPTIELGQSRVAALFEDRGHALDALLEDGRLSVIDAIGGWDESLPNVHATPGTAAEFADLLADVGGRTDRTTSTLLNADAVVHSFGADGARTVRYRAESTLLDGQDRLVHVTNPAVVDDTVAAFHRDSAEQVLHTWIEDDGLQYVRLKKSPCGFVGTTSLVEYVSDPPYLRVQDPPLERESPSVDGDGNENGN